MFKCRVSAFQLLRTILIADSIEPFYNPRVLSVKLTPIRIWLARGLAVAADAIQLGLFPLFAEGAASPINDGLDVMMAIVLTLLIGWHMAFIPTFFIELIPFGDLAPTWTVAVLIATRKGAVEEPLPKLEARA